MQTFAEWLDAQLAARRWSPADLTQASKRPDFPRGLNSGVLSRLRRRGQDATRPSKETCDRIAEALGLPWAEVYAAAGLLPGRPGPDAAPAPADPDLAYVNARWPRLDPRARRLIREVCVSFCECAGPKRLPLAA
jgi:hypothetical protein